MPRGNAPTALSVGSRPVARLLHILRGLPTALAVAVTLLVGNGCKSYPERTDGALRDFHSGQFDRALRFYANPKKVESAFLSGAEAGTVALTAGDWESYRWSISFNHNDDPANPGYSQMSGNDYTRRPAYGGNPISMAAAQAVLDVIEEEGLQENSRVVGGEWDGRRDIVPKHNVE